MRPAAVSTKLRSSFRPGTRPGSRPALIAVIVAVVLVLVVALLAARAPEFRYLNIPGLHPYPPPGMEQNPFNPSDRADLISAMEAAQVRSDQALDGTVETEALANGDSARLPSATTGRALDALMKLIQSNAQQGVVERDDSQVDSTIVGQLADPNDSSVRWCVEKRGHGTITITRTVDRTSTTRTVNYRSRVWLLRVGGRWLVADREVVNA